MALSRLASSSAMYWSLSKPVGSLLRVLMPPVPPEPSYIVALPPAAAPPALPPRLLLATALF